MTDRVWLGARGDRAANPGNWSPKGVPQPGDALAMTQGTMSIKDDDLAGNQLLIGTPAAATSETLNLSHHADVAATIAQQSGATVTVNVKGADALSIDTIFPSSGRFTVNLAHHARLTEDTAMTFSSVVVNGEKGARLLAGDNFLQGSFFTANVPVQGGNFTARSAQGVGSVVEFAGAVHGTTTSASGDPGRGVGSSIVIDQPERFNGSVALDQFGGVTLAGITGATSYDLKGDLLEIFRNDDVIATLNNLTIPAGANDFQVAQTAGGVTAELGSFNGNGTLLPLH